MPQAMHDPIGLIELRGNSVEVAGVAGDIPRMQRVGAEVRELQHSRVGGRSEQRDFRQISDVAPAGAFLLNPQCQRLDPLTEW